MSADGTPTLPPPPPLSDRWALFLDVDGTLVEFADHPERVVVPAALASILGLLVARASDADVLRIASFNVNGIRAAQRRGIETWWAQTCPDILAIQEMRAPAQAIPEGLFDGWHLAYHEGNLPGRNGVALLSRTPPAAVRYGFGHRASDPEGRYVEADYDLDGLALRVGSVYVPKGATWEGPDADPAKYRRKMQFMASFRSYLTRARREAAREGREFLVMGDFNIAHTSEDLKNWRSNQRSEGFLPEEREWFGSLPATLFFF